MDKNFPTWNFRIPISLYREINAFLHQGNYRKLLNCSKSFRDVRKETLITTLKDENIEEFVKNREVKDLIQRTVQNPGMQISFYFSNFEQLLLEQLSSLPGPKFRLIQYCSYDLDEITEWKSLLTTWKEIEMYNNDDIKELTDLENLFRLKLTDFSVLSKISNVSSLRDLYLLSCPIIDVSPFSRLTKLVMIDCNSFSDVSPLKNVYHLTIRGCLAVNDISSLTNNHYLSICGCKNIQQYSIALRFAKNLETNLIQSEADSLLLENVVSLKLKNLLLPRFILSENNRRKLHSLEISRSTIENVASFSCPRLSLQHCSHLVHLEGLSTSIRVIELVNCKRLVDISALRIVSNERRSVYIKECARISDFSPIQSWYRVCIEDCFNFVNSSDVSRIHHLSIKGYNRLASYQELGNIPHLEINACKSFISLEGLEQVPILEILHCNYLPLDTMGFGIHQKLILSKYYFQNLYESFPDYFDECYEIYSDILELSIDSEGNEIDDYREIERDIRVLLRKRNL
jgi:hypothetical protein